MIDLWFTMGSTYTYLTIMRLDQVEKTTGLQFNLRPFNRAAASNLKAVPFPEGSTKLVYMWRDIERRSAMYRIPVRIPAPYPAKDSVLANLVAIVGLREGWGKAFIRAAYTQWFQLGKEMGGLDNLTQSLSSIGQEPHRALDAARSEETQQLWSSATVEAGRLGVFGSPSFVVGEEVFWGDDRLEDALLWRRYGSLIKTEEIGKK